MKTDETKQITRNRTGQEQHQIQEDARHGRFPEQELDRHRLNILNHQHSDQHKQHRHNPFFSQVKILNSRPTGALPRFFPCPTRLF